MLNMDALVRGQEGTTARRDARRGDCTGSAGAEGAGKPTIDRARPVALARIARTAKLARIAGLAAVLAAVAAPRGASAQRVPPDPADAPAAGGGPGRAAAGDIEIDAAPVVAPVVAPVKDPKLARRWLAAAQQLVQRGSYLAAHHRPDDAALQFDRAVAAYRKAIDASDDLGLYLELASAEDKLGKFDDAVRHLRLVVHAPISAVARSGAVRPEISARAAARLEQLSLRVGLVTLAVTPAGTAITLGGSELGTSPLAEPLVLLPGTYTLAFQAEGYQALDAELRIEPGSEIERAIALEPVHPAAPTAPTAPAAPAVVVRPQAIDREAPGPSRRPLVVTAGITGAAALSAAICGALAVVEHARFTARTATASERDAARTTGARLALAADLSLVTAIAAGGMTAYWYFHKYRPSRNKSEIVRRASAAAKLGVVPWVQTGSGGVTIAGRF
jgi:tetratricopeptide (TPR) repeat protein